MSVEELLCAAPGVAAESVMTVSLCEVQHAVRAPAQVSRVKDLKARQTLELLKHRKDARTPAARFMKAPGGKLSNRAPKDKCTHRGESLPGILYVDGSVTGCSSLR